MVVAAPILLLSSGSWGSVNFQSEFCPLLSNSVHPAHLTSPHPPISLSTCLFSWRCVLNRVHLFLCVCVCVKQYEVMGERRGWGRLVLFSTKPGPCVEMQPPGWTVLSLPTSPAGYRGFGAGSWPFVSKQMEMGRGEVEDRRGGGVRGGGEWTEEGEGGE